MKQHLSICFFGTYDPLYTSNKLILQGFCANGIHVVEVNAAIPLTPLNKNQEMGWWPLLKRILRKYRLISETIKHWKDIQQSDVIYVGYPGHFDVFPAWIIAKLFGKKIVFNPLLIFYTGFAEEQSILHKQSLLARVIKFGEGIIYRLCDLVIADTPYQQEFIERIFHVPTDKIRTVALGADDRFYPYTPYTNKTKKIIVAYYGLYSPIHGVEYILDAASALKKDPDISFMMVGNRGQTFEQSMNRVKKEHLTNVTFFYDIPQTEHIKKVQQSDIFLGFLAKHPSVDRVIPNKVYQGLSLGKVVLTADAPVIRSVFTHKDTVYMVPPANSDALVKAILELKNNPELRAHIAKNGYRLFKDNFSPKVVGGKIIQYIKELYE